MSNMKIYILIPAWQYDDFTSSNENEHKQWWDIPHYFMKIFHSKKDIEKYLNETNDPNNEYDKTLNCKLHSIMVRRLFEKHKNDSKTALKATLKYRDVNWFVVTCDDDVSKENRIGLMQKCHDKKSNTFKWKYVSFFGGKVWRDDLLFRGSY